MKPASAKRISKLTPSAAAACRELRNGSQGSRPSLIVKGLFFWEFSLMPTWQHENTLIRKSPCQAARAFRQDMKGGREA